MGVYSESAGVVPAEGQGRGENAEAEGGVDVGVNIREEVGVDVAMRVLDRTKENIRSKTSCILLGKASFLITLSLIRLRRRRRLQRRRG